MIITKECKLKSEDIKILKFSTILLLIAFVTWIIEISADIERIYVMPFVCLSYFVLVILYKKLNRE